MKAAAEAQRRLLDLQASDTAIAQLDHKRNTLPETTEERPAQEREEHPVGEGPVGPVRDGIVDGGAPVEESLYLGAPARRIELRPGSSATLVGPHEGFENSVRGLPVRLPSARPRRSTKRVREGTDPFSVPWDDLLHPDFGWGFRTVRRALTTPRRDTIPG